MFFRNSSTKKYYSECRIERLFITCNPPIPSKSRSSQFGRFFWCNEVHLKQKNMQKDKEFREMELKDMLSRIRETFDFEKVHKAMIATDWNWVLGKDEFGVDRRGIPDLPTIKNEAFSLLKKAYETGDMISSGGFSAGIETNGELYLIFTLEQASTD